MFEKLEIPSPLFPLSRHFTGIALLSESFRFAFTDCLIVIFSSLFYFGENYTIIIEITILCTIVAPVLTGSVYTGGPSRL